MQISASHGTVPSKGVWLAWHRGGRGRGLCPPHGLRQLRWMLSHLVFGRITHFCCLPEEAKNYASCCKGDQRHAVAQGVNGLHQNVERDLKEKRCVRQPQRGPPPREGLGGCCCGHDGGSNVLELHLRPEPEMTLNAHLFPSMAP